MTDREASRRAFRVGLFERRLRSLDKAYERTPTSSPLDRAERLADLVLERDRQRDDRRLCIECAGLQRTGYCQAAGRGLLGPSTSTRTSLWLMCFLAALNSPGAFPHEHHRTSPRPDPH